MISNMDPNNSPMNGDNGPPFNSRELREWFESYGILFNNSTPLNPTENGLVERRMSGINKVASIARLEKRSFEVVLADYVADYSTWPHHSTKIPPAELMFGRVIHGFLPNIRAEVRQRQDSDFRIKDMELKIRRNQIEDRRRHAGVINIEIGDTVLVHQQKHDKADTPYTNYFYEVMDITGGRVTVRDKNNGNNFDRSIKHLKKFEDPEETHIFKESKKLDLNSEFRSSEKLDAGEEGSNETNDNEPPPKRRDRQELHAERRSERSRKIPKRFSN